MAKVFHSELWGLRKDKYGWLQKNDLSSTKWNGIAPKGEMYLFVPRDEGLYASYEKNIKITEIFPVNSVGVVTSRDEFVIDFDRDAIKRRIAQLKDSNLPDDIIMQTYGLKDKSNWSIASARNKIRQEDDWEKYLTQILYRPFDIRWIYFHDSLIERSRKDVMQHMLGDNLALCVGRAGQVVGNDKPWNIVFCSQNIEDFNIFYRGGNVNFPLYLQESAEEKYESMALFNQGTKKLNLSKNLMEVLSDEFNVQANPEDIFHYIYAVLYSETYRKKYAEFLKIDFPRVPFTRDYELFKKMAEYGGRLAGLHLLKSRELDSPSARFQGRGDGRVEKPSFSAEQGRVYINADQYFEGLASEVWNYQIGGYQVCDKWLKDRKQRVLTVDESTTYCRIVTAIARTISIQADIDEHYESIEATLLAWQKSS